MTDDARDLVTMVVDRAESPADVLSCRRLLQRVYGERYGVVFTDEPDPSRKLEPWPDRFVLGRIDGEIAAMAGLYEGETYAEAFGGVTWADIERVASGAAVDVAGRQVVEYTKLVVEPGWEHLGLGAVFLAVTHSRGFLAPQGGPTPLVVSCGKVSKFGSLYRRARIHTRTLSPFPEYASHERYRTANDPMENRLIVPELDLDPITHSLQLPLVLDLAIHGDRRVA